MQTTTGPRTLKSSAKKNLVQSVPKQIESRKEDQGCRASENDCSQRCDPRSQRETMTHAFCAEVVCPRLLETSPRVLHWTWCDGKSEIFFL